MQNNSLNFKGGVKPFSDKHKNNSKYTNYREYITKFFTKDDDEYIKNNISCSFILIESDTKAKPIISSLTSRAISRLYSMIDGAIKGVVATVKYPIMWARNKDDENKYLWRVVVFSIMFAAVMTGGASIIFQSKVGALAGTGFGLVNGNKKMTKFIKKFQSIPGRVGTIIQLLGIKLSDTKEGEDQEQDQNQDQEQDQVQNIDGISIRQNVFVSLYKGLSSSSKFNINTYDVYLSLFDVNDKSLLYINLLELTSSTLWSESDDIIPTLESAKYYIIEHIYNEHNQSRTLLDNIDVVKIYYKFKKIHSYKEKRTGILFYDDIDITKSKVTISNNYWTKLYISTSYNAKNILILRPTVANRKYPLYEYLDNLFNISSEPLSLEPPEELNQMLERDFMKKIDFRKLVDVTIEVADENVGGSRKRKNAKKSNRRHSKKNRSKKRRSKRISKSR